MCFAYEMLSRVLTYNREWKVLIRESVIGIC